jgi:hypothetical protein
MRSSIENFENIQITILAKLAIRFSKYGPWSLRALLTDGKFQKEQSSHTIFVMSIIELKREKLEVRLKGYCDSYQAKINPIFTRNQFERIIMLLQTQVSMYCCV